MADSYLLLDPEHFDEVDQALFQVQLRNLHEVSRREARLTPYHRLLLEIAHKLYPVGAEAFKESLLRLKQRVREDGNILNTWKNKCETYQQNKTFEEVRDKLSWLPLTLSDVYVLDIVARIASTKKERNTKVHFLSAHVVGPGVQAAFKANLCLWSFYFFYPFIAYLTSFIGWWTCKEKNFAEYDVEVLMLCIPVVLAVMYFEYKATIYALPPLVAILGKFERRCLYYCPSRIDSFSLWFLGASFMSLAAHMDLATNSLFLSKVLVTKQCEEMTHIEDASETVFTKTVFRFFAEPPRFLTVVFVSWCLVFGQFFYAVASSVPLATHADEPKNLSGVRQLLGLQDGDLYEVKDRDLGAKNFGFKIYPTILHPRTQHGGALQALAESARMYTIRYNEWSLQRKLAQLHLYKSGQLFKEVRRTLAFFIVFMCSESFVQLELQGYALELGKASSQKLDKEIALSLLLSLMMTSYNYYIVLVRFWNQTRACMDADEDDLNEKVRKYNRRVKTYCKILRPLFFIVASMFGCLLLLSMVKTLIVSFVCECGWNFWIFTKDGCFLRPQNGTSPFEHSDGMQ